MKNKLTRSAIRPSVRDELLELTYFRELHFAAKFKATSFVAARFETGRVSPWLPVRRRINWKKDPDGRNKGWRFIVPDNNRVIQNRNIRLQRETNARVDGFW